MKKNTTLFHVILPDELKDDIKNIAEKERRSMSSLAVVVLQDFVNEYKKKNKI